MKNYDPSSSNDLSLKKELRLKLLEQRAKLSNDELTAAEQALRNIAFNNTPFKKTLLSAQRVISYTAFNGEISPLLLTTELTANIYLPKILDYQIKEMAFFSADQHQIKNRYGIYEPTGTGKPINLDLVDIMLVPLVGFDDQGNRIGMGAGFYDRVFANATNKPLIIGLGHDFQQQSSIQADVWDEPLDVILTPQQIIDPKNQIFC